MLCPVCNDPLVIVEWDGIELDVCIHGHGLWFDTQELKQLFRRAAVPETLSRLERDLLRLPEDGTRSKRRCPRCGAAMRHVKGPGDGHPVILDQCPEGHGLWFDEGELEEVVHAHLGNDPELRDVKEYLLSFVRPSQLE